MQCNLSQIFFCLDYVFKYKYLIIYIYGNLKTNCKMENVFIVHDLLQSSCSPVAAHQGAAAHALGRSDIEVRIIGLYVFSMCSTSFVFLVIQKRSLV